jgi:RNA polymerase sigma-70 factor (ECF subfamily)
MTRQAARDYGGMAEAELVACVRNGDRDAFGAIMRRCNQRLFRVARAVVGSDDEAEDVLQESYLRAFARIGEFRGDAALLTWLTAIVLNEARGRLRKRRNLVDVNLMDQMDTHIIPFPGQPASSNPEGDAGRDQVRQLLEKAIDTLPHDFRIVFMLREVEGCDVEETARQLGLNPQTVKSRLFRARLALRRDMEKRIAGGIDGIFPFLGARCEDLTERVLARLERGG